ncbi:LysR family transcriptional regulator [Oceanimonas sp. CAM02]|uniref:LysR family transcriptional regulator n=1 Tax=Oceanimonas sp. CAM02 TaxID=3080336 RepID=UPI002936C1B3|nr:LysR family transcriptional regulator [Oceanimonas sp. CAM02]MDV2857374.1 LysR family transcriptional regulator [Oceanimonas sp. CAM02]
MQDLFELEGVVTVVACGSLTEAARRLGVPKSTLSRRLSQLESRLGQPLLHRRGNRLQATEAGVLFERYSRQILHLAEQGRQAMDDLKEEISGELVIKVHSSCIRGWFPGVLQQFMADYPGVSISLYSETRAPPAKAGQNEIWLWVGDDPQCGLRHEVLGHWPRRLYMSPDYAQRHGVLRHPQELPEHVWIDRLSERHHALLLRHEHEGEYIFQPLPSRLKADDYILQLDAIANGQGIGVLPEYYAEAYLKAHPGRLQLCLPEWRLPPLPVGLLYSFGRQPKKQAALLSYLRQSVPAEWTMLPVREG